MKEIEKNALNDVLRTIILINEKITEEISEIQKQSRKYLFIIFEG
ncbi:MAG: hypothetical protein ACLVJN_06320 [Streptococcus parasanguinis]